MQNMVDNTKQNGTRETKMERITIKYPPPPKKKKKKVQSGCYLVAAGEG